MKKILIYVHESKNEKQFLEKIGKERKPLTNAAIFNIMEFNNKYGEMRGKANSALEAPKRAGGEVRARWRAKRKRSLFRKNDCFFSSESRVAPVKRKESPFLTGFGKGKIRW